MSQPTLSTPEKVVEYIGVTSAALEKAAAAEAVKQAQSTAIEALIPQAVEELLKNERIQPHQKEAAANALRDPVKAVEMIIKLAGHRNTEELSKLGSGVPVNGTTKTASRDRSQSLRSSMVGGRSNDMIKESDAKLFAGLGLPVPTS